MIYITGDTHGEHNVDKLFPGRFPDGKRLTKDDYLIITGDFGAIWYGNKLDDIRLEFWEEKPYTVLFVDGNHENFHALNKYPVEIWNGGKIHRIRNNVIHLMRGQIFTIEGKTFFTFGGGLSIDKINRIPGISWWEEEEPSMKEMNEALDNLEKANNQVDYIITHAAPETIMRTKLCKFHPMYQMDCLTEKFLDHIFGYVKYKTWFCGHYHFDRYISQDNFMVLYNDVIKLSNGYPIVNTRR